MTILKKFKVQALGVNTIWRIDFPQGIVIVSIPCGKRIGKIVIVSVPSRIILRQ
jgi:hypothetical protein